MIREPGVYALLLALDSEQVISVGRRGSFQFPAGFYMYVGSAEGPGGLAARLGRHCRQEKRLHWHIDYLLPLVRVEEIWALVTPEPAECVWAAAARRLPGASIPARGFGSSDCRCEAHLVHLSHRPRRESFVGLASIDAEKLLVTGCHET